MRDKINSEFDFTEIRSCWTQEEKKKKILLSMGYSVFCFHGCESALLVFGDQVSTRFLSKERKSLFGQKKGIAPKKKKEAFLFFG